MPVHIKLSGDTAVAGSYVGLGHTMLRAIKGGIRKGSGTSVVTLPGVRIEAKIVDGQEHIYIEASGGRPCELYLESGFADTGQWRHNYPNASDPARVFTGPLEPEEHYFGKMAQPSGEDEPLKGTAHLPDSIDTNTWFKTGEHSPKSFFKAPRLNETVPSTDPYEATDGSGEAGAFPISGELERKKEIVAKVHPSIYSGKLRLFVQAVFGAAFSVFKTQVLGVNDASAPALLTTNGIELGYSHGLYTADDGSYWLLHLGSKVTVRRINLTPCGKALSQWLVQNPATDRYLQSEFEAYILAGAIVDKGFTFTLADIPTISPVAYGWKFNWKGSQAKCVSARLQGTLHDTWWDFETSTVNISRDDNKYLTPEQEALSAVEKERLRWTVTSDTIAEGSHNTYWQRMFIWVPTGLFVTRWNYVSNFQVPKYGQGPFYGWYNENDEWKTVSLEYNAAEAVADYESHVGGFPPHDYIYDGLNITDYLRLTGRTSQKLSFTVVDEKKEVNVETGGYWKGAISVDAQLEHPSEYPQVGSTHVTYNSVTGQSFTPLPDWEVSGYYTPWDFNVLPPVITNEDTKKAIGEITAENQQLVDAGYTLPPYNWSSKRYAKATYTRRQVFGTYHYYGSLAVVIPQFDSEAAYLFSTETETETPSSQNDGSGFITYTQGGGLALIDAVHSTRYIPGGYENFFQVHYAFRGWGSALDCPYTSSVLTDSGRNESTTSAYCYKKDARLDAIVDNNFGDLFDSSILNQQLDQGNYCFTYTSAVYNYVNGSNVSPSHVDFVYPSGTFIGWV